MTDKWQLEPGQHVRLHLALHPLNFVVRREFDLRAWHARVLASEHGPDTARAVHLALVTTGILEPLTDVICLNLTEGPGND